MDPDGHFQQGPGTICIATLGCAGLSHVLKGFHEISRIVDSGALRDTRCGDCPGSDVDYIEYGKQDDQDETIDEGSQGERHRD
jgi:hypothetical protein